MWAKVFRKQTDKQYENQNRKERKEESNMRIEAYTQVQQIYQQSQKTGRSQYGGSVTKSSDKLQISTLRASVRN